MHMIAIESVIDISVDDKQPENGVASQSKWSSKPQLRAKRSFPLEWKYKTQSWLQIHNPQPLGIPEYQGSI